MKEPITIDFHEIVTAVNSTSFCQIIKQYSPHLLDDPYNLNNNETFQFIQNPLHNSVYSS